jgi:peptidoglycan/xylan/chitin deacetylase (PgdA/CDA1 family)
MMSIGLHCRIIGRPGRSSSLERFIDYAQGFDGVWFATREETAESWLGVHGPNAPPVA